MIYLDHHSATRPSSQSIDWMNPYFESAWGASFSPHQAGRNVLSGLQSRYQMLYDLVSAPETAKFVFTSSGAEAVNQVFWSVYMEECRGKGKTHIIVSSIEDLPTLQCAKRLEELGCTVKIAPVDELGRIDTKALEALISPRTALISVTAAHGLTGVIQPIDEISRIAKEKKVLLHVEASYAVGKCFFAMDSDYLTFSGDKIHSVKSSGALFAATGAPLSAFILGGTEQNGLRGGAFDAASFAALASAAQQAHLFFDCMALEVARLRDLLEEVAGGTVLYKETLRLPNVSAIVFDGVHAEALLYLLDKRGVCASIGGGYSPHLSSMDERAISFALSRMTTEEEVRKAGVIIQECVKQLQKISEGV